MHGSEKSKLLAPDRCVGTDDRSFLGGAGRCVGTSGQVTVLFIILTAKN